MEFYKSVFAGTTPSPPSTPTAPNPQTTPPPSSSWASKSTFFRTIASKSESFLDNYYKDLQEFSSTLKKETSIIREAASRAVQDLPARLESGAAIAQESLETVGEAIDNVGSTVSVIIGKDLNFASNDDYLSTHSDENDDNVGKGGVNYGKDFNSSRDAKPYSRIEAMIRGLQCNVKTYCEEVEESGYGEWKMRFRIEERREEIEKLFEENEVIKEIFNEVIPKKVDENTFWCRYFYRVDKVIKTEEARLRIVKRAILEEEEEELSWDFDDDDDDDDDNGSNTNNNKGGNDPYILKGKKKQEVDENEKRVEMEDLHLENEEKENEKSDEDEAGVSGTKGDMLIYEENLEEGSKFDEKASSEGKIESDFSVISSQRSSHVGDDFGWDEIEDIGSGYERKVGDHGNQHKEAGLQKQLSDEEELTWDIEDDDHQPINK